MLTVSEPDGRTHLLDARTGAELRLFRSAAPVTASVYVAPRAALLFSQNQQGLILSYSPGQQQVLHRSAMPEAITCMQLSPCGSWLVSGSADGTVFVHSVATGEMHLLKRMHIKAVAEVAFNTEGTMLASCSEDTTAKVWSVSLTSAAKTASFGGSDGMFSDSMVTVTSHSLAVTSCAFMHFADVLVTCSQDRTCRLTDAVSGVALRRFVLGSALHSLCVHPMDSSVAVGAADGSVFFVNLLPTQDGEDQQHLVGGNSQGSGASAGPTAATGTSSGAAASPEYVKCGPFGDAHRSPVTALRLLEKFSTGVDAAGTTAAAYGAVDARATAAAAAVGSGDESSSAHSTGALAIAGMARAAARAFAPSTLAQASTTTMVTTADSDAAAAAAAAAAANRGHVTALVSASNDDGKLFIWDWDQARLLQPVASSTVYRRGITNVGVVPADRSAALRRLASTTTGHDRRVVEAATVKLAKFPTVIDAASAVNATGVAGAGMHLTPPPPCSVVGVAAAAARRAAFRETAAAARTAASSAADDNRDAVSPDTSATTATELAFDEETALTVSSPAPIAPHAPQMAEAEMSPGGSTSVNVPAARVAVRRARSAIIESALPAGAVRDARTRLTAEAEGLLMRANALFLERQAAAAVSDSSAVAKQ